MKKEDFITLDDDDNDNGWCENQKILSGTIIVGTDLSLNFCNGQKW
mgnify:CR=1 FL=1